MVGVTGFEPAASTSQRADERFFASFRLSWGLFYAFGPISRPISPLFTPVIFLVTVKYGVRSLPGYEFESAIIHLGL